MAIKLICIHPFHDRLRDRKFVKGDEVTDASEIERFNSGREKHFVRVAVSDAPKVEVKK